MCLEKAGSPTFSKPLTANDQSTSAFRLDADRVIHYRPNALCSRDIARSSELRHVPATTGSAPVRLRAEWHSLAQVRLRSWGASLSMSDWLANSRTTCQTIFSVIDSPQILPALFTRRKTLPDLIPAAHNHWSMIPFAQSGIGTVRTCPALPLRSTMAEWASRHWTSEESSETASCRLRPQASSSASSAPSRFPRSVFTLRGCQPIPQPPAEFLDALHSPDARCKIRVRRPQSIAS